MERARCLDEVERWLNAHCGSPVVKRETDVYLLKMRKRGRTYEYGEIHVTVPREWVGQRVVVVVAPIREGSREKEKHDKVKEEKERDEVKEKWEKLATDVRELLKQWEERDRLEKLKEGAWRQVMEKIREFHEFR